MPESQTTVGKLWDDLWMSVKTLTGACAAANQDLEKVKELLTQGSRAADLVAAMEKGEYSSKLKEASSALDRVCEGLDKVENLCEDITALNQIQEAMKVLNDQGKLMSGSDEVALAFGQLFVGAGHFLDKAGPPVAAYAPILTNAGRFFYDMMRGVAPLQKKSKYWDPLRQVEREGYNG